MSRRFCCSLLWPALVSAGCVLGTVGNMEGKGWDPCFWGPLLASTVLSQRWSRALPGCFGNSEFQTWIRLCVLIRFPVIYVQDKFVKNWLSRKNNSYKDLERDEVQRRLWLKFFLFGVLFQFQSRFILELQSECSVLGGLLVWTSRMGTFSWSRLGQSLHSWQAPSSAQYTPSAAASDRAHALPPCRGLRAVTWCHIAPVSVILGEQCHQGFVSELCRSPFQTCRHWNVGFRLVVIHKYKCLHLIFPVEGNINSIERDLFWLSKLELNVKAVLFFLLSIEAVVGEENPKNRPLSE